MSGNNGNAAQNYLLAAPSSGSSGSCAGGSRTGTDEPRGTAVAATGADSGQMGAGSCRSGPGFIGLKEIIRVERDQNNTGQLAIVGDMALVPRPVIR